MEAEILAQDLDEILAENPFEEPTEESGEVEPVSYGIPNTKFNVSYLDRNLRVKNIVMTNSDIYSCDVRPFRNFQCPPPVDRDNKPVIVYCPESETRDVNVFVDSSTHSESDTDLAYALAIQRSLEDMSEEKRYSL